MRDDDYSAVEFFHEDSKVRPSAAAAGEQGRSQPASVTSTEGFAVSAEKNRRLNLFHD